MSRWVPTAVMTAWSVLCAGVAQGAEQHETEARRDDNTGKPNILIIVVDDQGYADLSAYEHHAEAAQTPNMDRLAARGVLFTQAYVTAPVCSPSRAGWTTGRHQVRWDPTSSFKCGLPDNVRHIAEIMKENGYATARFGKSDYGQGYHRHDHRSYPLNHGYDEFLGFCGHGWDYFLLSQDIEDRTPDSKGSSASLGPLMHGRGRKAFKQDYLTEIFTDAAIDYLERHRNTPFFLTLSYNSVHHLIHQVPKRYLDKQGVQEIPNYDPATMGSYRKWFLQYVRLGKITADDMRKYYLANLNCLDDNIGRVLNTLDELKLADNTVVVFFSDNGGPPTTGAWNRPLAGSKFTLWEGGIRVPFILSRPGDAERGTVCDRPISTLDIVPTCLQAAGIERPDGLDGRPIPKDLTARPDPRHFFWRWGNHYAVRSGDWKLLYKGHRSPREACSGIVNRDEFVGKPCLFNLGADPSESRNLLQQHPEVVQRLQRLYAEWSKEVDGPRTGQVSTAPDAPQKRRRKKK